MGCGGGCGGKKAKKMFAAPPTKTVNSNRTLNGSQFGTPKVKISFSSRSR